MTRRVVLIGATGAFGSRLARMLARVHGITLIVTSRRNDKAQALVAGIAEATRVPIEAIAFAHGDGAHTALKAARPWLVIDASGPFQAATYDTARAAISVGAHWIDLADAAGYIVPFPAALDALARAKGVTAITGASSTPALSFAALSAITQGWQRIDNAEIAIYPAGGGDVGRAVIEAVLSYAGTPVGICRDGKADTVTGWGSVERVFVEGLGWRWRSPVATADYALLPALLGARNVQFYAGLESPLEQLGLVALARARQRGWLRTAAPLAPVLHNLRTLTKPFCGLAGAMVVEARGVDGSMKEKQARWSLLARNGDGPNVPVLAALALTKKLMMQSVIAGASDAARSVALAEIEAEMTSFEIDTQHAANALPLARAA